MIVLGVDPGVAGGLAVLEIDAKAPRFPMRRPRNPTLYTAPIPAAGDPRQVSPVELTDFIINARPTFAVLESAHAFRGQGVSSTFKFGTAYGITIGVIGAIGIPLRTVAPATWKRDLGIPTPPSDMTPREKTTWRKRASVVLATELYPDSAAAWKLVKNNHLAEAALIAHWGWLHRV